METFRAKFRFDPAKSLMIGVERECFLVDLAGDIVPAAPQLLEVLTDRDRFGYELSACQLEERVGPSTLHGLRELLVRNDEEMSAAEKLVGVQRLHIDVAPETMPLDVYPDPTGRYREITRSMPREVLCAACRIVGTHVHVGMPDHATALAVYNAVIGKTKEFSRIGDRSGSGERLRIYRTVAPDCDPRPYQNWEDFYVEAHKRGCVEDPRRIWTLIRISVHGTLEFRMFGVSPDFDIILEWVQLCHDACREAMAGL
ncbi:MAG: hypothetical protein AAB581_01065 [Patescibacteria group bacterium]